MEFWNSYLFRNYRCKILEELQYFWFSHWDTQYGNLLWFLELRSTVYSQSSASARRSSSSSHKHEYATEEYDPSTDTWTKSCSQCGHTVTFEKMWLIMNDYFYIVLYHIIQYI